jgi:formylglycine-generating enzyme required for sulfatase activity
MMKPGLFIYVAVVAAVMIAGCKSSPTGGGKGGGVPQAPVNQSPANGAIGQSTSPTLIWNASSGATSYAVEVSTAAAFSTVVSDQAGIAATSYGVTGLSPNMTYYWRVNASDSVGTSVWSNTWSFITASGSFIPSVPALASPLNGATGQSTSPALIWNASSGATSYGVQVSALANFSTLLVSHTGVTATQNGISGLAGGSTCYWRVNATDAAGTSAWSGIWSFTTQTISTVSGMAHIPGGTFQMGGTLYSSEQPIHTVTVSDFYMDSTDVTQADFQALMGVNPSYFNTGVSAPRRPVETVTWFDAVLYCNKRSKHDGKDTVYSFRAITKDSIWCTDLMNIAADFSKSGYRLPTEAEWEYACRAGSTTDYYWGQSYPPQTTADTAQISTHAWWYYNSPNSTQPVATKPPNALGLYDMSGNVWQWCNDWYGSYSSGSQTDPMGAASGSFRVLRGGSWYNSRGVALRSAVRGGSLPYVRSGLNGGFRCVRR